MQKQGGVALLPQTETQNRPSVAFCVPGEELLYWNFFTSWIATEQYRTNDDSVILTSGSFTWIARNGLVKNFLKTDCEYLYFWDSDTCPPTNFDFITRLLSHKKDIVSGWYRVKKTHRPTVYNFDHWDEQEKMPYWKQYDAAPEDGNLFTQCHCGKPHSDRIEKVDATGAGCLLIHRRVFEQMPEPWFGHFESGATEDMYWYWKVREMGLEAYVDWAVHCAHIGVFAA